jgi:hypothetical protein
LFGLLHPPAVLVEPTAPVVDPPAWALVLLLAPVPPLAPTFTAVPAMDAQLLVELQK